MAMQSRCWVWPVWDAVGADVVGAGQRGAGRRSTGGGGAAGGGGATRAAIADITDMEALRDLGVAGMEVGWWGTADLEASVLATMNLQSLGVPSISAKARSDRHATILRRIGADRVVQPEKEGASGLRT